MNKLIKSFSYAIMGIRNSIAIGKNLRIQLSAGLIALTIMPFFAETKTEYAILIFTIILIPTAEIVNTAIEHLVDLITLEKNYHAGAAKDAVAGAVLVCCIGAVGVGLIFFSDKDGWNKLINYCKDYIWYAVLLVLEVALFCTVVFVNFNNKQRK